LSKSLKPLEVFFGVVLHRVLYNRDCVVWLALVVRTRVVVIVATPLILFVVVAARVVLALATNGVVLSVRLVLFVSQSLRRCDGGIA
jgi:hypothetical protein